MTRADKAEELFKSGYNCSQSVIGAFAEDLGLDFNTAMKISEGFGGGMGRMRLTCGAVAGMVMAIGMIMSDGEAGDLKTREAIYGTVQKTAREFEEMNGSIVCGDLLGINRPKDNGAKPTERTEDFYKKRPCSGCVRDCVTIAEKYLK